MACACRQCWKHSSLPGFTPGLCYNRHSDLCWQWIACHGPGSWQPLRCEVSISTLGDDQCSCLIWPTFLKRCVLSAFNSKIRSFFLTLFEFEGGVKMVTIIFTSSLNTDYPPLECPIFVKQQTGNTSVAFEKIHWKKWIFYNNQLMSKCEHAYLHARFDANASLIIYEQSSWMFYVRINIWISHISFLSVNSYDNPSSRPIWNHYDFFNQNGKQIQFDVLTKNLILGLLAE